MQIKTNIHAGITPEMLLSYSGNAALGAAQWIGTGALQIGSGLGAWVSNPQTLDVINRAFWFPMQPPF